MKNVDRMSTTTGHQPGTSPNSLTPKQKLIRNERVRLWATALNNGAVTTVVAAVVGPTAYELYGITAPKSPH